MDTTTDARVLCKRAKGTKSLRSAVGGWTDLWSHEPMGRRRPETLQAALWITQSDLDICMLNVNGKTNLESFIDHGPQLKDVYLIQEHKTPDAEQARLARMWERRGYVS